MRLSRLERFLRLFTEVRPGEGPTAALMFANVFLILLAYYFIKPLREQWIVNSEVAGLDPWIVKTYTSFGQGVLLVGVVAWYSGLVDRLARARLYTWATLFCMSNMVVFWFLQPEYFFERLPLSGIVFYLWVGMFGVFVVAQFWAFAADVYDDEDGRRLMPVVAIGATAGGAFGSYIGKFLVDGGLFQLLEGLALPGPARVARAVFANETMLLVALVPLAASIWLTRIVDRRRGSPGPPPPTQKKSPLGGVTLVLQTRFLVLVAGVTMLLNWVNTNGEALLTRVLLENLADSAVAEGITGERALEEYRGAGTAAFYRGFYGIQNAVALALQAFVASRLLRYGGFGAILLVLPVVALASYTAMALLPILSVVKALKIAENATDYSLNNTARHVLWLPVPSDVKFKGKPAIDSLYARFGDGFAAVTVLIGGQILALATATFFAFNVVLVLVWIAISVALIREHGKLAEENPDAMGPQ